MLFVGRTIAVKIQKSYSFGNLYSRKRLRSKLLNHCSYLRQNPHISSHTRGFEHALSGLMDLVYPTHFFSVYDLSIPEEDGDIFEYLMSDRLSASAEEIVLRALTMKSLYEQLL